MQNSVISDVVKLSLKMVSRNRRRYKFVILAISVGISGFIILLNVSDSIDQRIGDHLLILGGATIIDVERSDLDSPHPGEFHLEDVWRLQEIPHVSEVAPVVATENIEAVMGQVRLIVRLVGVDGSFWNTIMASCEKGRLISDSDVKSRALVGVLGGNVYRDLFDLKDPIGKIIQIDNTNIEVIGVLGGIQGSDTLHSVFIPLSTARHRFNDMYSIKHLRIRSDHWTQVEKVAVAVRDMLRALYPAQKGGLRVTFYPERINRVQDTVSLVKVLVYLLCSATILLGSFGAAYLMMGSIQERTREIGLKKALGAKDYLITLEFLLEALFLCLLGGFTGVISALIVCAGLELVMKFNVDLNLLIASSLLSIAVTLVVGLCAGVFPAISAGRMSPVNAMRFE